MNLLGTHQVRFDAIRALAIECHALDLSAYDLLLDGIHKDESGATKASYEELFTSKLLLLAIAIRTKFYQGVPSAGTEAYVVHCGLMATHRNGVEQIASFNIKDICDKVIHADYINRHLEPGVVKPMTVLGGARGKETWELAISVSLFTEAVLNWVQRAEET